MFRRCFVHNPVFARRQAGYTETRQVWWWNRKEALPGRVACVWHVGVLQCLTRVLFWTLLGLISSVSVAPPLTAQDIEVKFIITKQEIILGPSLYCSVNSWKLGCSWIPVYRKITCNQLSIQRAQTFCDGHFIHGTCPSWWVLVYAG